MDLSNSASANSFFKGIFIVFFANSIDEMFGGIILKGENNPIKGNKDNATRKSIRNTPRVNSMAVLFTRGVFLMLFLMEALVTSGTESQKQPQKEIIITSS